MNIDEAIEDMKHRRPEHTDMYPCVRTFLAAIRPFERSLTRSHAGASQCSAGAGDLQGEAGDGAGARERRCSGRVPFLKGSKDVSKKEEVLQRSTRDGAGSDQFKKNVATNISQVFQEEARGARKPL